MPGTITMLWRAWCLIASVRGLVASRRSLRSAVVRFGGDDQNAIDKFMGSLSAAPADAKPVDVDGASEYESTELEGAFPAELVGTLYRLGPGTSRRRGSDRGLREGYGMVLGVTFCGDGGAAIARARYVRTEAFVRESRGYKAGSEGCERNTGSGAALYWAGKLYALTNGCKPYQLDPLSLGTQKKSELGGLLANPEDGFDAWARPAGGTLTQAAVEKGLPFIGGDELVFSEFDAAFRPRGGGEPAKARVPLAKGDAVVDISRSARSYVALVVDDAGASRVAAAPRAPGAPGADKALRSDPLPLALEGAEIAAVDDESDALVLTVVADDAGASPSTTRPFGRVWRVVVDAKTGATRACDALDAGARPRLGTPVPAASGDEGASFFATDMDDGALLRLEAGGAVVDTWREDGVHVGPPTLVDGTHLLALLHGAESTDVAVFDAADLERGPSHRAALPRHVPNVGLDGPFAPDVAPSKKDLESSETLARLYARKSAEWNEVDGGFSGLGIKSFLFPKGVSGG